MNSLGIPCSGLCTPIGFTCAILPHIPTLIGHSSSVKITECTKGVFALMGHQMQTKIIILGQLEK